jgi:hypothetical protein
MLRWLLAAPVLLLITLSWVAGGATNLAQDKAKKEPPPTFTDPQKAGTYYQFQGEYQGATGKDARLGAQVIARGDGSFDIVFLPGGLPGEDDGKSAGWDGKTRLKANARYESKSDDATRVAIIASKDGWTGTINLEATPVMKGTTPKGEAFQMTKIERQSKTLGAAPPRSAIVLFDDSKNLDEWKNGKLSDDGYLLKNATTKKTFQDFLLHIEFRLPFMPKSKGQGRANSGVHPQNRYEIQVLDSFGLDPKKDDCAAIYGETPPSINMCYPPLRWQTYDVEYKAARFDQDGKVVAQPRITVFHNGVKVHDNVEIKGKANPAPGPLHVSEHGNPVVYRNIWIVPTSDKQQ